MVFRKFLTIVALVLCTSVALADISLDEAKRDGLVGEDASGYLAAVSDSPSQDVLDLIRMVNAKRHDEYARIAEKNGIEISDVEKLAGRKAIEKTAPGLYIRLPGKHWQTK